jgi:hypothetical protein
VQRLEEVRGVACQPPEFQVGYVKNLPAVYTGDRHLVTVGRELAGGGLFLMAEISLGMSASRHSPV